MTKKITPPSTAIILPPDDVELPPSLAFTPVPRRTKRWNGLTELKQRTFIANLASCGCVEMAAASVGASDAAFYTLRKAEGAESFAAAWEVAIDMGAHIVLDKLMEHAIHGTPERLLRDGEVILERRKYNTRAMMWIVSQRFPEKYGSATGLMGMNGMSHAMQKLKAKWEAECLEAYKAEQAAQREEDLSAEARRAEEERRELLPAMLVRLYQKKVREERRYRLNGQTLFADHALRSLVHLELYMELAGLVEPEIKAFFDSAQADPHPWETETSRAIEAHRHEAWAMDGYVQIEGSDKNTARTEPVEVQEGVAQPLLRPPFTHHTPGTDGGLYGGKTATERTKARQQAERQMAEAQRLWEACATEESWAVFHS